MHDNINGAGHTVSDRLFNPVAMAATDSIITKGGDQYFTPKRISAIVQGLISEISSKLDVERKYICVFEPCAGDGRNLAILAEQGHTVMGLDFEIPRSRRILHLDYQEVANSLLGLCAEPERAMGHFGIINPPFAHTWESDNDFTGYTQMESRFLGPVWNHLLSSFGSVHICNAASLDRIRQNKLYADYVLPHEVLTLIFPGAQVDNAQVDLAVVLALKPCIWDALSMRDEWAQSQREITLPLSDYIGKSKEQLIRLGQTLATQIFVQWSSPIGVDLPTISNWNLLKDMAANKASQVKQFPYTVNLTERNEIAICWKSPKAVLISKGYALNGAADCLRDVAGHQVEFLQQRRDYWRNLRQFETAHYITIDPALSKLLLESKDSTEYLTAPLQNPQGLMRLANLLEHDRVVCSKTLVFTANEETPPVTFQAGIQYHLTTYNKAWKYERPLQDESGRLIIEDGKILCTEVRIETLAMEIGFPKAMTPFYSHCHSDLLLEHFAIPGAMTVSELRPDLVAQYESYICQLEADFPRLQETPLYAGQRDLLRLSLMKPQALLAADPGCGKTLMALCYALIRIRYEKAIDRALIFCPPNLFGQKGTGQTKTGWIGELDHFFGTDFVTIFEHKNCRKGFDKFGHTNKPGLYLASTTTCRLVTGKTETIVDPGGPYKKPKFEVVYNYATDPLQGAVMARTLVICDEATAIKGTAKDTRTSESFARINSHYKLLLTGTPGDNYAGDVFRLLHWLCTPFGDTELHGDARFPVENATEEYNNFRHRFHQVERIMKKRDSSGKKYEQLRILPKMSNHVNFWYVTRAIIIRATKQSLRPDLPKKIFVPHWVDMASGQREVYEHWVNGALFTDWFCATHEKSDGNAFSPEFVYRNRKILGQLQMLRGALNHPHMPYAEAAHPIKKADSPYTYKVHKIVKLCLDSLRSGRKVVFLSDHLELSKVIQSCLAEARVKTLFCGGKMTTKQKGKLEQAFKSYDGPIAWIGTLASCARGINLQGADMIIGGLPWNYALLNQGTDRVHRINTTEDVHVHVVSVANSYDSIIWELCQQKEKSAGLAFDGIMSDGEYLLDWDKILKACEDQQKNAPKADAPGNALDPEIHRAILRMTLAYSQGGYEPNDPAHEVGWESAGIEIPVVDLGTPYQLGNTNNEDYTMSDDLDFAAFDNLDDTPAVAETDSDTEEQFVLDEQDKPQIGVDDPGIFARVEFELLEGHLDYAQKRDIALRQQAAEVEEESEEDSRGADDNAWHESILPGYWDQFTPEEFNQMYVNRQSGHMIEYDHVFGLSRGMTDAEYNARYE